MYQMVFLKKKEVTFIFDLAKFRHSKQSRDFKSLVWMLSASLCIYNSSPHGEVNVAGFICSFALKNRPT